MDELLFVVGLGVGLLGVVTRSPKAPCSFTSGMKRFKGSFGRPRYGARHAVGDVNFIISSYRLHEKCLRSSCSPNSSTEECR
jgi:hypothetical protein